MAFIVSARKYRPQKFKEVVGQGAVTQTLKNALRNDKLAQSFLFCGPRGVGKTTCARLLAKVINCHNPGEEMEPCGSCESCTSFNQSASFNIFELDAASNNSVDDIRRLIDQVRFAPQAGKYKVYIIDEVHMLSQAAFNAFLKTLEEPPSYAVFILATTEKHKIIPTILSRCQIFDFSRIKVKDIVEQLRFICADQEIEAEENALHVIGQKADGALRDALSIFDRIASFANGTIEYKEILNTLNILDYDYFFKITDAILSQDSTSLLLFFDEILQKGFEGEQLLNGLAEHFRNLLVCKDPATLQLLDVTEDLRVLYQQQSLLSSPSLLLSGLNVINQCDIHYKMSQNKRLHVELGLLKLSYINSTLKMADQPVVVQQVVQKQVNSPATSETETKQTPLSTTKKKKVNPLEKLKAASIGKSVDLTNIGKKKVAIPTAKQADTEKPTVKTPDKPKQEYVTLTEEILRENWQLFKPKVPTSRQSIFKDPPKLNKNKVTFKVNSKLNAAYFKEELEYGLRTFLRTGCNIDTDNLIFEPIAVEQKVTQRVMSPVLNDPRKIYKIMQQENPKLRAFITTLSLTPA